MNCKSGSCLNKWCAWLQASAQVAVAGVIVYAGFIINTHMKSWTTSFEQGAGDLHSIRQDMGNIAFSIESINNNMETIKTSMNDMTVVGANLNQNITAMNDNVGNMVNQFNYLNQQIDYMNYNVNGMKKKFSPVGIMRSFVP